MTLPVTPSPPHSLTPSHVAAGLLFQLAVAVYGGFFGAGIGILMLAALGLMGMDQIHRMNGVKNFAALCVNGVAAVTFIAGHAVNWPLALLMAAIGLYGIMSYTVVQRTQEISIRMALGATRHEVLGMILRESLLVVAAGAIVGAAAAQAAARVVSTLLFGVSAQDPATAVIVVCVLVAAALAAAFIPARRAAQTEPIVALHYD